MNEQNYYVNNDVANNTTVNPQPTPTVVPTNTYTAPSQPQPSSSTFDYNQLYGNNSATKVEQQAAVVFEEESVMENASIINPNENQIKISNDELIPEFDASVLEVVPNQQQVKIEEKPTSNVNTMAMGKQAEKEKNRSNILFISILFGVIIVAVMFIFPMLVKF